MISDLLTLLGLLLNFAGTLLLVIYRLPALEITADGLELAGIECSPEARRRNLRRYWRHASATRAGLVCLCLGFALQLLGFVLGYGFALHGSSDASVNARPPVSRSAI